MHLFLIAFFCLCVSSSESGFNGTWKLDKSTSESPDDILEALGINWFKRRVIVNLDITETIHIVVNKSVRIHTVTPRSNTSDLFLFGVEAPFQSVILGDGTQVTTFINNRLFFRFKRGDSDLVYSAMRELLNPNLMKLSMNVTMRSRSIYLKCTRFFKRS